MLDDSKCGREVRTETPLINRNHHQACGGENTHWWHLPLTGVAFGGGSSSEALLSPTVWCGLS